MQRSTFWALDRTRRVWQSLTRSEFIGSPLIIEAMRTIFLILMIALLPLRAWLGDGMAVQNMPGPENTLENIAVSEYSIRDGGTFIAVVARQTQVHLSQVAHAAQTGAELGQRMAQVCNSSKAQLLQQQLVQSATVSQLALARLQAQQARAGIAEPYLRQWQEAVL